MKEERMFILKMVQDGKITADEAVKLLESISPSHSKSDTIIQVNILRNRQMIRDQQTGDVGYEKYKIKSLRQGKSVSGCFGEAG